jgi:hypothetical protein
MLPLLALENGQVSFHWKDYADDHRTKVMRLSADEFIRLVLLHVLPKRFVRIRHYGLLAGRNVATHLGSCREFLAAPDVQPPVDIDHHVERAAEKDSDLGRKAAGFCPAHAHPSQRQ